MGKAVFQFWENAGECIEWKVVSKLMYGQRGWFR